MRREFTGRHMAAILVVGFGIVMAVNFTMAAFATNGFGGVVVENSYVASQNFNDWLDEAEKGRELGWSADIERDGSLLAVTTDKVPERAIIAADIRRPLGKPEHSQLTFEKAADGRYFSVEPLPEGRWIVRLTIEAGPQRWAEEVPLG